MHIKINVKNASLYIFFGALCVLLNGAVSYAPLSLSVYFPLLICGGNAVITPLVYIAASAVHFSLKSLLCALYEAGFLLLITLIYRKTGRKIRWEAPAYICAALVPYVVFGQWTGAVPDVAEGAYIAKGITALLILALFFAGWRAVYAIIFRLGRCRLKEDELISVAAIYVAAGFGAVNLTGAFAYFVFTALFLSFCIRYFKNPNALITAVCAALPLSLFYLDILPLTYYLLSCLSALIFSRAGRLAPCAASSAAFCACAYVFGWFTGGSISIGLKAAAICAAGLLPAIPKESAVKALKNKLYLDAHLSSSVIARERALLGERIFKIAEALREVECAFCAMDAQSDEKGAKARIFRELKEGCCAACEKRERCEKSSVYTGFGKLIEAGTIKGKVNLIDLPPDITRVCFNPAEIISRLNALLTEYRRYMTEAENARSGRQLLAEQAKGVSVALKNCAIDLCKKQDDFTEKSALVKERLAQYGISCPELFIRGEGSEVCALIFGKVNVKSAASALKEALGAPYILAEKSAIYGDKCCYTFKKPPRLDAAFGVAARKKEGEKISGDTHSVIKINEHKFLVALCDGMGSGEYAHKVSATAISLIEAFYRAEMPEGTVLDTINKLISFNSEERFACIDIAAVELETGRAELVKIGSPAAVILRKGEIKIVESQSLPLGILDNLHPTASAENFKDGDFIVFMSDGITEAFSSNPELVEFLQPIRPHNPQQLADRILEGALARTDGTARDDMTVLCVRIFLNQAYC